MHELALEKARERLADAKAERPREADIAACLDRTRTELGELSRIAAGIEAELPERVAEAIRAGVRREAGPVGRQLAEVRGLATQITRRLERLEEELTAERFARIDDLGLLVDLIGAGWSGVDERLARIEEAVGATHATVHRLGDRRADDTAAAS